MSIKRIKEVCFNSKMVRLRGLFKKLWRNRASFQFQNGAIKRSKRRLFARAQRCFNSKMVRLRDFKTKRRNWQRDSFNSKMVRLRVMLDVDMFSSGGFQFQNGAIKRIKKVNNKNLIKSFNSKMVRLRVRAFADYVQKKVVSIPKWCD